MACYSFLVFFVISQLLLLSSAEEERELNKTCPFSFPPCGNLSQFTFPFTNRTHPECGLMVVDNCNEPVQRIRLGKAGPFYNILNIAQDVSITLEDQVFQSHLNERSSESFKNLSLPSSASLSFEIKSKLSLFRCTDKLDNNLTSFHSTCNNSSFIYYNHPDDALPSILPPNCSLIQLPVNKTRKPDVLFNMLTSVFSLQVEVQRICDECHRRGGQCQNDSKGNFQCENERTGLEYLHLGCSTRILHFDIKPHNILLDEDFCPKISDFGLAKICNRKESIISMTGARGTVGYIAPEVFCRNIGEVSYKSDVYSYGMMIFEMTGGRKNVDVGDNGSSDIYFPHWIYKRLEKDEELGLQGIENEQDKEYARKMIIVSLWCIQTNPSSRPTMNRVVEMLEASLDSLQIPPKPFLSSPGSPADSSTIQSIADSSKSILITL
ncbi:hypothetical protein CUMW_105490 [Citrus unshiu]|uniref:Protein kinase domain-containing protein n=1 Tax=Citrus unshiu TaxID=55188 RepID=A0A2H5P5I5_CITUN|nr:hypothetical protein CUMW_105490 [Citrus unshiu]